MSNFLIVESANDTAFIEAILEHENKRDDIEILPELVFEEMEGLNLAKLIQAIKAAHTKSVKEGSDKIGILLDLDKKGEAKRLELVNQAIKEVFSAALPLERPGQFQQANDELQIGCCLTHVNGEGELETLLRTIHKHDASYADCLESWKACLKSKGKTITQKSFDKFWIATYHR